MGAEVDSNCISVVRDELADGPASPACTMTQLQAFARQRQLQPAPRAARSEAANLAWALRQGEESVKLMNLAIPKRVQASISQEACRRLLALASSGVYR